MSTDESRRPLAIAAYARRHAIASLANVTIMFSAAMAIIQSAWYATKHFAHPDTYASAGISVGLLSDLIVRIALEATIRITAWELGNLDWIDCEED